MSALFYVHKANLKKVRGADAHFFIVEAYMDYFELKREYSEKFAAAGIDETSDIDWAMVEVLGVSRGRLPFYGEISRQCEDEIRRILNARERRVPLAYILKKAYFYGREFEVNKSVLIPRGDTEILAESAINYIKHIQNNKASSKVLDLCTGSGILAVTIALETGADVLASDISKKALSIAKRNAKKLDANVKFFESDLFDGLTNQKFDAIVSNPPYIRSSEIDGLEREVSHFEPRLALDGGEDGLEFYRRIADGAVKHLKESGMIFLEIGYDQADAVKQILSQNFEDIQIKKDLSGNDRVIQAKICMRGFYD